MRDVSPLRAARVVTPSKASPGPSPYMGSKWSNPHAPSKPSSSASWTRLHHLVPWHPLLGDVDPEPHGASPRSCSSAAGPRPYPGRSAPGRLADSVPRMRVLVLGAGFGGLELTTRLSEALGDDADVVLIDQADGFVFGFSKLDVMFGRTTADRRAPPLRRHRASRACGSCRPPSSRSIPAAKRVETDAGPFEADVLVVALGADLHPEATPGLVEGGHEFYTVAGAFALRDVLADFEGGRVIVGVTSTPFKCPPAPSETALLDARLPHRRAGLRERSEIVAR